MKGVESEYVRLIKQVAELQNQVSRLQNICNMVLREIEGSRISQGARWEYIEEAIREEIQPSSDKFVVR